MYLFGSKLLLSNNFSEGKMNYRPIRSLRCIITCTRMRALAFKSLHGNINQSRKSGIASSISVNLKAKHKDLTINQCR